MRKITCTENGCTLEKPSMKSKIIPFQESAGKSSTKGKKQKKSLKTNKTSQKSKISKKKTPKKNKKSVKTPTSKK